MPLHQPTPCRSRHPAATPPPQRADGASRFGKPTRATVMGLTAIMVLSLCLLLAARQSTSCFSGTIQLKGGGSGGGGGGSASSGEAEYIFVNFVGENSTVERRSCGHITDLRSNATSRHQHYPRRVRGSMGADGGGRARQSALASPPALPGSRRLRCPALHPRRSSTRCPSTTRWTCLRSG